MKATHDIALARCFAGFVTGVFVHALWTEFPDVTLPSPTALESATVALVLVTVSYLPADYGIIVIPLFAATVLLFAYEAGGVSRLLRRGAGQRLGELSYSVYMVHALLAVCVLSAVAIAPKLGIDWIELGPVAHNATGIVTYPGLSDAILILFLVVVIGCSMLSYRWIEKPWRERAKQLSQWLDTRLTGIAAKSAR
jgi:peptidoglycan/LPS O-acetylase OafA/YrhL